MGGGNIQEPCQKYTCTLLIILFIIPYKCITHASAGACALLRRVYAVMLRSLPCPGLITNVFFNYLIFNNLLNYW